MFFLMSFKINVPSYKLNQQKLHVEAFIYRHEYGRLVLTKYIYTHVYNIFLGSGSNMPLWDFVFFLMSFKINVPSYKLNQQKLHVQPIFEPVTAVPS
jgi:predicted NAD/FAD-binding protein